MKLHPRALSAPGRLTLSGAPPGVDARIVSRLARQRPDADGPGVVFIARDDVRLAAMEEALRFFAPGLGILRFPAWDCLPYDRASPHADIAARRIETLAALADGDARQGPRVLLTTINAALQRVPPKAALAGAQMVAAAGQTLNRDMLSGYLGTHGYRRTGTVMEPGEYALRGGIIDIFPTGHDFPLRLDCFGEVIESIRRFDPLTQRSGERIEALVIRPVSEAPLDDDAIRRFRGGYVEAFGAALRDDPLYEAISAGRRYPGMEHWLPLFYPRLGNLVDYAPEAFIVLDYQVGEAATERHALIADHYRARRDDSGSGFADVPAYKPLEPARLYLSESEWQAMLDSRPSRLLSPHRAPEGALAIDCGGIAGHNFSAERARPGANVFDAVGAHLDRLHEAGKRLLIACYSDGARQRLAMVMGDHGIKNLAQVDGWPAVEALPAGTCAVVVLAIENGFETAGVALIAEQDILGDRLVRQTRRRPRAADFIADAATLSVGELVVHAEHGIGRFDSLQTITVDDQPHDCVQLSYQGGDRLLVPIENIEVLSRYGAGQSDAALDRLGGSGWQSRKARLKKQLLEMADELIRLAALRQVREAPRLPPPPGLYEEFCARFPYQETEDQQRSIEDVIADFATGRPMDRLVCGDVGFGKTEVALRSAFIAAFNGVQVAIIAPTTLLARQHFASFSDRFAGLPVNIAQLSRFVPAAEAARTREGLANGQVDIVIGTHALLGKTVKFHRLGLLIVDEEQHFGVVHKEQLKALSADVHVLTLTATPIPRTLQLALSGVRSLSLIATPPVDRLSVRTFISPFDGLIIREALLRERFRGGQSFYVCPRVSDLPETRRFLEEQVPELRIAVGHGQMPARALEKVMQGFYDGAYDVLLSTTIIESGLDIPTANTLIVHRADRFGLAQLYQLRGRIGRAKNRGYAYFTVPPGRILSSDAEKRLKVLQSLDTLGAGFSLASHDLDIRGAGNLLGEEQSGHVREVGLELYQEMLESAVAEARTGDSGGTDATGDSAATDPDPGWSPQINLGMAVLIPEEYVADLDSRMTLYRRIARLEDEAEIDSFAAELIDRFGPLPAAVENLFKIIAIKKNCRRAGIEKIDAGPKGAIVTFRRQRFANPGGLVEFLGQQAGSARLRPDHRLVYKRDWSEITARIAGSHYLCARLAEVASADSARARSSTA